MPSSKKRNTILVPTHNKVAVLESLGGVQVENDGGAAFGDLFNDGRIDIVVENLDGKPMILRPVGGLRNHWISFELAGTKSNRLALNARVKTVAGDLVQVDEVDSGWSYLSQNDLRVHFGLGVRACRPCRDSLVFGEDSNPTDLPSDHFFKLAGDQPAFAVVDRETWTFAVPQCRFPGTPQDRLS